MIEELFPTKSLYATLAVFFDFPDDPLHPRLIARVTGIDLKGVRRQLPRLVTRNTRTYIHQTPFPDPLGFLEDLMDDGE
jgi:hypothetical protein